MYLLVLIKHVWNGMGHSSMDGQWPGLCMWSPVAFTVLI